MRPPLPSPRFHRIGLALAGYLTLSFGPILISLALLYWIDSSLPLLALFAGFLVLRQVNGFVVTALYHRSVSHRSVTFHPALRWSLRLWGWGFLGVGTRTWGLVHRWHHATADTPNDPHSPRKPGGSFWNIGRQSVTTFWRIARQPEPLARFAAGLPDDRLEHFIRREERRFFGVFGLRLPLILGGLVASFTLLSLDLSSALLAALASLPAVTGSVLAGTILVINGLGHLVGYQNFALDDDSMNVVPVDVLNWGEALHQNHHAVPQSANMAIRAWEWDPAHAVLAVLERVGLVTALKTHRLSPRTVPMRGPS